MADSEAPARATTPRDLTTGPIAKTLLFFALPTLGANVLQSLNGSINSIWVGRFLGEAALAATANANTIMFLMFSAIFGLAMATTIMIGQSVGARDMGAARQVLGSSIGLVLLIAVATAIIGWIETPRLLRLLSTPAAVMPLAVDYLRFIFVGMPFSFMTVVLAAAMRGAGDAVTPLRAMVVGVIVDAGLNPFLILGLGPFPAWGIAGSAIATLVASLVSTVYLVERLMRRDNPLRIGRAEARCLIPRGALARAIVGKGVPMGLTLIVLSASMIAMMGLVNREGVDTGAAFGAISQLWNYIQMPALAIGAAVSAMAAQNVGAGRWDRVERIAWAGSWMNIAITSAAIVAITLADRWLLGLFLPPGSVAIGIGVHIHHVVSWSFILFGVSLVLSSVMRANGAVIAPLLILFVAFFPVRFGAALAFYPTWRAEAIWWSFPLGSVVALILTLAYYRRGNWRQGRTLASVATSG